MIEPKMAIECLEVERLGIILPYAVVDDIDDNIDLRPRQSRHEPEGICIIGFSRFLSSMARPSHDRLGRRALDRFDDQVWCRLDRR
jgi:hypothetical protein